jgi:hypothetical protein
MSIQTDGDSLLGIRKGAGFGRFESRFAEYLVGYWLARVGCEVAWADIAGIDVFALNHPPEGGIGRFPAGFLGVQVKARARPEGREGMQVKFQNLPSFESACERWNAHPIMAFVADFPGRSVLHVLFMELSTFKSIARQNQEKGEWALPMNRESIESHLAAPDVLSVTFSYPSDGWNSNAGTRRKP